MKTSSATTRMRRLGWAVLLMMAGTSQGALTEIYLRAGIATNLMPDGRAVVMWGFAQDSGPLVDDGTIMVPGPAIQLGAGSQDLLVHLKNRLPEPVSIVIPGQQAVLGDPQRNPDGRVRSFTHEAAPGGTADYTWTNLQPGTYLYHSGTHSALQVQMGLYGPVTKLAGVGEAYSGVPFDSEAILLFSEIDPDLHDAVAADDYGPGKAVTSTLRYQPKYFFINGAAYTNGMPPLRVGNPGDRILLRLLNLGLDYHAPTLDGAQFQLIAEDGTPLPYPRDTYAAWLPPLKTMDALFTPAASDTFAFYDRRLALVNSTNGSGGMLTHLKVSPPLAVVVSRTAVNVRENGEGRFFVKLDQAPVTTTTVLVARVSGDADLTVQDGGTLKFTPGNWDIWKDVTLAAADDADAAGGTATFEVAIPGLATQEVAATELDDDIGSNLALATGGSTITGTKAYNLDRVIDGVHTSSANYGRAVWTNVPPGTMTLDLKAPTAVTQVRLLNYDWDPRVHSYTIESSLDGTSWSMLVDASAGLHAGWEDWATNRTARYLKLTGLSNSASANVAIAEWEVYGDSRPAPVVSRAAVNVRENGEGRFFVKLDQAPMATTTVLVARVSGDTNLTVKGGGTLKFTPANWNTWKDVTLAAANDADADGGTATFQASIPGLASQEVAATELDDDIGANLALATSGSTIAGMKAYNLDRVIDGVHTSSANYGRALWTNVPPGTMTLDLQESTAVTRVRLLNYDWDPRIHRYTIESSLDGTTWSMLVDASAGSHAGWEDWATNRTARYLKLTGLSNSASANVAIAEWEVYGTRPGARKRIAPATSQSPSRAGGPVTGLALGLGVSATSESTSLEFEPVMVMTSDDIAPDYESGWAAVDGDPETVWVGQKADGGYLVVEYAPTLQLKSLEVDMAEGSLTNLQYLYSADAKEWKPLPEDMESNPVSLNFLWLLFPGDGTTAVPQVIEIHPNP